MFLGNIYQCIESVEYGDAVSTHVIKLEKLIRENKYNTKIYSEYVHHSYNESVQHLSSLKTSDLDIIICHYSGFAANVLSYIMEQRCTKVLLYHNITPHAFFSPGTESYEYCRKGREQLPDVIKHFHYFWGVSNYNLQELIDLGADPAKCSLIPIIVDHDDGLGADRNEELRESGGWLFVGRVAPNKGHTALLDAFHKVKCIDPSVATKLYFVGNTQANDLYFKQILERISQLELTENVVITGKVADEELSSYFRRASFYVSMSEHEGFGVPLIEASHYGLPVLALNRAGTGETLGSTKGLFDTVDEFADLIRKMTADSVARGELVRSQKVNSVRFTSRQVSHFLSEALSKIIPSVYHFQKVSIVICTHNRAQLLERTLKYLQYQTNPNFEVVVVDSNSTDRTAEILEEFSHRIKIAKSDQRNLSISRNLGIEHASGDLISFIDDDAIAFDDFVETVLFQFNSRPLTTAGLGGPVYFRGTLKFQSEDIGINRFAKAWENIPSNEIGTNGWERSLLGTNATYRGDILRQVGGFDEQFDYFLDESELSFRLQTKNYLISFCPDLYVRHEFAQSPNRISKYNFNWFCICKNTAYFIAAYSGLSGEQLITYVENNLLEERGTKLDHALKQGELTQSEHGHMIADIRRGIKQGLMDAEFYPRTRDLTLKSGLFRPFDRNTAHPTLGRDLKRLHICILTKELQPFTSAGGNGTQFYNLASELLLMGHFVTVVLPGDYRHTYRQGRFVIEYVPVMDLCGESTSFHVNVNWSLCAFAAIAEIHKNHTVDVLESTLWDSEALAFALLPNVERPPMVVRLVTPFAMAAKINGWRPSLIDYERFNAAEKTLIENADAVMPISDCISKTIKEIHNVPADYRWVKSYCGIAPWPSFDPWENYSELTHINGKPVQFSPTSHMVLFVGRLEQRKGVDLLLSAANTFLMEDANAVLVIAGQDIEGFADRVGSFVASELLKRIYFLGGVDNTIRDKLLHAAYCLVFPSRYESFGFVPLEAFVHHCPVIAMRAGAIPEVVSDQHSGLLFEEENSDELAKCVVSLLKNPKLRDYLAKGAQERSAYFSSRRMAINTLHVYDRILTRREGAIRRSSLQNVPMPSGSSPAKTIFFNGASPRMRTTCGKRLGKEIRTTGESGFLIFGPYLDLPPGTYSAELHGMAEAVGDPISYADVVANSGNDKLAQISLKEVPLNTQAILVSMVFELSSASQIEVRIWVSAKASLSVTKLVISSLPQDDQHKRLKNTTNI
jgi:glycosyltransferase involved in cell wall biosynthesis